MQADALVVDAWGPGATWAVAKAPTLVGSLDDVASFKPQHDLIADLHRRFPGLRIPRSEAVFEAMVPAIVGQKVTSTQAAQGVTRILRHFGEPAPGPAGLLLPPEPAVLARAGYWTFHPFEIERRRADALLRAAGAAGRLEEAVGMSPEAALARLTAIPGIGPWTAAEVAQRALGDADAVSVGDYHVPNAVCWALAGEARGTDERMLELLEPYRGHRARVQALLQLGGIQAPKFGPRRAIRWVGST
jgi:3-methyladenine DNA glycosylase/8-oxoguanine DNA glycosylase